MDVIRTRRSRRGVSKDPFTDSVVELSAAEDPPRSVMEAGDGRRQERELESSCKLPAGHVEARGPDPEVVRVKHSDGGVGFVTSMDELAEDSEVLPGEGLPVENSTEKESFKDVEDTDLGPDVRRRASCVAVQAQEEEEPTEMENPNGHGGMRRRKIAMSMPQPHPLEDAPSHAMGSQLSIGQVLNRPDKGGLASSSARSIPHSKHPLGVISSHLGAFQTRGEEVARGATRIPSSQGLDHPRQEGGPFVTTRDLEVAVNRAVRGAIREMGNHLQGGTRTSPQQLATANGGLRPTLNGFQEEDKSSHQSVNSAMANSHQRSRGILGSSSRRSRVEDSLSSDGEDVYVSRRATSRGRSKLPPFMGKESWEVWMNRFEDVAETRDWSQGKKLEEIIPLLQGDAGEFVYGQLTRDVRRNYKLLVKELTHRFRLVEVKKTYSAKFSHRSQGDNEDAQTFAADLKRLYDKAHPDRDRKTRTEDILRQFLDGLEDEEASFHVEFVKDPQDVDEAVSDVISYLETKKRPTDEMRFKKNRKTARAVKENLSNDERAARLPGRPPKQKDVQPQMVPAAQVEVPVGGPTDPCLTELRKMHTEMTQRHDELMTRVGDLEKQRRSTFRTANPGPPTSQAKPRNPPGYSAQNQRMNNQQSFACYNCGQLGHFARSCTNYPFIMGQFQMASPPDASTQQHHQGPQMKSDPKTGGN